MKRTLTFMAMMFMSTLAFAQIEKGTIQLGGNFNYNKTENRFQESTLFQIIPRASLFIAENKSLGLSTGYSYQETPTGGGGQQEVKQFLIGAFSRFHKNVNENFYLFLQPGVTIGINRLTNGVDQDNLTINLVPGMMYFVSDKVALEMNLGELFYRNANINGGLKSDNFGLNFNLSSILLGASIYLR